MSVLEQIRRIGESVPEYYRYSNLYLQLQTTIAEECEKIRQDNVDIELQMRITTATWGLKYWEQMLNIPTIVADGYEIRRSRVLSKWRSAGNFSAAQVRSIAEAFSNGEVRVVIRVPEQEVIITFIGVRGLPPNLEDLQDAIEKVVLAPLGVKYVFTFLTWRELDNKNLTWEQLEALNMTWEELEEWI